MALTTNKVRPLASGIERLQVLSPIAAGVHIYQGAALSRDANGNVQPLDSADGNFAGFAAAELDNTGGTAGAASVLVLQQGIVGIKAAAVTGLSGQGDVGATVFASDDDTFRSDNTGAVDIGVVTEYAPDRLELLVKFQANTVRSL